jgi:predicted transcriptional regulator
MQQKPLIDTTIEVLKNLPPDSRMEDIMYELHLTDQVLQGLEDAKEGRVISTDELLQRMKKWRKG